MALVAGTRLGPYEILAELGAGGMGEVWRARDPRVDRLVALKLLPEAFFESEDRRARFAREAKLLASLNHPNVAVLYSFEEIPGSPSSVLVMELLEGETLRSRLLVGAVPVRKALDVAVQMAKGLAAAHAKGIVHRDLKPENVFVTPDGRVKLLDFGLAKTSGGPDGRRTEADTVSALTEAGVVMGTAGYMSPEQVRGEPVDHRSDVFSFGTILYELLAGKNPFRRDTPPESLTAILKDEPPPLDDSAAPIGAPLSKVVARCLEKDPGARFQSSDDLAFALETLGERGPAATAGKMGRSPRPRASLRVAVLVATLAVLAALSGAYLLGTRRAASPSLSFQRLTFRRGFLDRARFAPDGQTVLYGATWDGEPVHVYSTRIGSPETSRVNEAIGTLLSVSRSGELALALRPDFIWGWRGTLARVPLGGGSPREILAGATCADFSPDGSELAVSVRDDEGQRIELPPGTPFQTSKGRIDSPRFSPDGRLIAFFDRPRLSDAPAELSVVDRSGKKTVFSKGWWISTGMGWSPGGDEVWLTGGKTAGSRGEFHAVNLAGRERILARWPGSWRLQDVSRDGRALLIEGSARLAPLVSTPTGVRDLGWFDFSQAADVTPDGKLLLFAEWGEGAAGGKVAFLRSTDGSPPVRLGPGIPISLSHDGGRAIVHREEPTRGFVLLSTGVGSEKRLPPGPVVEFGYAAFFPDGTRIVFEGGEKGRHGLYLQGVDGGPPKPFGPPGLGNPRVSADGNLVVAVSRTSTLQTFSATGEPRQTVPMAAGTALVGWAADGRSVFLSRVVEGLTLRVERLDLESGQSRVWREIRPQDPAGVVAAPFGAIVTPDGGTIVASYVRNLSTLYLVEGLK